VRGATALGRDLPLLLGVHVLEAASTRVRSATALGSDLSLPLGIHAGKATPAAAASPLAVVISLAPVRPRVFGVQVGPFVIPRLAVPRRLAVVVRRRVVMESRGVTV